MKVLLVAVIGLFSFSTSAQNGETLYQHKCSACHMGNGMGIPGAFPNLKDSQFVALENDQLIATIMDGRGGMPTFKNELSDQDFVDVISYIKSAWGPQGEPVSTEQVATIRKHGATHTALARQE